MRYDEFINSLSQQSPPAELSPLLQSLWYDGRDDWESSHNVAQDIHDVNGSWIHAYLHRKEGDISNARYWYSVAGKKMPDVSLKQEWESLVREFLKQ